MKDVRKIKRLLKCLEGLVFENAKGIVKKNEILFFPSVKSATRLLVEIAFGFFSLRYQLRIKLCH